MADSWLQRFKLKIIAGVVLLLALSMTSALLLVNVMMRDYLLTDSSENTRQLGSTITSSLRSQMLRRSPEHIQQTLHDIGRTDLISETFLLNRAGHVVFSSDESMIGKTFDHMTDESCRGCHQANTKAPASKTIILHRETGDVQRSVTVIYNEPACFGCHPGVNRINGKLIVDHSLAGTYSLIQKIRLIILASGGICLILIIPLLSRMINRYIDQINLKNNEINMVYSIIDNISRTIDMEELKNIVLDIVNKALNADEVDLILPKGKNGYRVISRSSTGEEYRRKRLGPEDPLHPVIERWSNGLLKSQECSADRTKVYLPIQKGEIRLALIVIHCTQNPFPEEKLKLVEAICNHIAIAFENARLYSIAITDELTGLFTVRHFNLCISRQMTLFERHGGTFSLLMIDIDNFKKVNDTYGHPSGDAVLINVAAAISESLRGSDLAFRYGGEEFTVILPSATLSSGLKAAERIRSQIEAATIDIGGQNIGVTVSIGLAVFPDNALTVKDLILEADKSLYIAKHRGKNRAVASETKPE